MKRIKLLFIVVLSAYLKIGIAQNINWSEDAACIIYTHCIRCHNNDNSLAALPLTNYNEVWSMRLAIKNVIQIGKMPPYTPSTKKQNYVCEKNLTNEEIEVLKQWIDNNCAKGDTTKAPPTPVYSKPVSTLVTPDITLKTPVYTVPFIGEVFRRCFVLPVVMKKEQVIKEIEIVPGNISAVYSVYVYADTSSIPLNLDIADTGIGYTNFGGIGSKTAKPLYGWVNGSKPLVLNNGIGLKVDSAARFILQVEYVEDAGGKLDSTELNIKFSSNSTDRKLLTFCLLHHENNLIGNPLFIPADSILTFTEIDTLKTNLTFFNISPNLHNICTNISVSAITLTKDTISLFEATNQWAMWNEGTYYFEKPVLLPAGTRLISKAVYNNTKNNPNNPNNPPKNVSAGYANDEEEMVFNFSFIATQPTDSGIVTDSVSHLVHYQNCKYVNSPVGIIEPSNIQSLDITVYPNPTSGLLFIEAKVRGNCNVCVYDMQGKQIECKNYEIASDGNVKLYLNSVPTGLYLLKITSGDNVSYKKIIIE